MTEIVVLVFRAVIAILLIIIPKIEARAAWEKKLLEALARYEGNAKKPVETREKAEEAQTEAERKAKEKWGK